MQQPLLSTKVEEKDNCDDIVDNDEIDGKVEQARDIDDNEEHKRIRIWLRGDRINMEQYYELLINNGFEDFNLIRGLNLDIMEQIGIDKIGHRVELLRRINNLEGNIDDNVDYVENEEGQHTAYM